jgi:hypothetical protein
MCQTDELVWEQKVDRVCELFEQLAIDAVTAALEKTIERYEHFERLKRKRLDNTDYPF